MVSWKQISSYYFQANCNFKLRDERNLIVQDESDLSLRLCAKIYFLLNYDLYALLCDWRENGLLCASAMKLQTLDMVQRSAHNTPPSHLNKWNSLLACAGHARQLKLIEKEFDN